MSPKQLLLEIPGEAQLLSTYVCGRKGCHRCYNELAGYFDLVGGKPILETEQTLCFGDAHAMLLEFVSIDGNRLWCCPHCGEAVKD